jgi:hypothetical protein
MPLSERVQTLPLYRPNDIKVASRRYYNNACNKYLKLNSPWNTVFVDSGGNIDKFD